MDRRQRPGRPGFTLVEVLIVILIIGTLIAILLPAIAGAVRSARNGQVSAELNNLATALASFKNTYGDYPPSRIILCETGYASLTPAFLAETVGTDPVEQPLADANCTDMTNQQLVQRSLLYLRKFWPRVDFNNGQFNFNNAKGIEARPYILSGSECLAFFLGGQPLNDGTGHVTGVSGFSKSPLNPFDPTATNRTVPNYEFNNGRLIDQDGDGVPSYIDPLNVVPGSRRGYAYFCSYGTNAYDPNDVNGYGHNAQPIYEVDDNGNNSEWKYAVGFPTSSGTTSPFFAVSPAPNPYTSGPSASGTVAWINPNSFQIICCGQDGLWGTGGAFSQNTAGSGGTLPLVPGDPGNINNINNRQSEFDNLSNFSGGRMN